MTERVRPGTRILLTFDIDAESAGIRESPDRPVALSKGQFALVGVPRVLDLLDRHGIRATFFTPAWTAQRYPELIREVVRRGHEIAAHGYLHEHFPQLTEDEERAVHEKSVAILEDVAGRRPVGFRAPYWEWTPRTLGFLRSTGFLYDSSLMDDDRPYRREDGLAAEICELPVDWSLDDWLLFEERQLPPDTVFETWQSEFDAANELGTGYFLLTMHPECIGRASRIRMLDRLVRHMHRRKGTQFIRCDELARAVSRSREGASVARDRKA